MKISVSALALYSLAVKAATVTYDWNITWVTANPDGMLERPVIGINGQWPLPMLNLTKGDRVIANVHNQVCLMTCNVVTAKSNNRS